MHDPFLPQTPQISRRNCGKSALIKMQPSAFFKDAEPHANIHREASVLLGVGKYFSDLLLKYAVCKISSHRCLHKHWVSVAIACTSRNYALINSQFYYSWGRWATFQQRGRFNAMISINELEEMSRAVLMYSLKYYAGDEKIKVRVIRLYPM